MINLFKRYLNYWNQNQSLLSYFMLGLVPLAAMLVLGLIVGLILAYVPWLLIAVMMGIVLVLFGNVMKILMR